MALFINNKNADNIDVFKQRLMKELKCDILNCDKFCVDLPKYYLTNSFYDVFIVLILSMYHACAYLSLYIFFNQLILLYITYI